MSPLRVGEKKLAMFAFYLQVDAWRLAGGGLSFHFVLWRHAWYLQYTFTAFPTRFSFVVNVSSILAAHPKLNSPDVAREMRRANEPTPTTADTALSTPQTRPVTTSGWRGQRCRRERSPEAPW